MYTSKDNILTNGKDSDNYVFFLQSSNPFDVVKVAAF